MSQQRNHRVSNWLYHTTFFTRFYGRMAGQFGLDVLWDELQMNFLNNIPDGGTILELGAGPGLFALRILESRPSLKIIVTDYSPNMIELAMTNLEKAARENVTIQDNKDQLQYIQANAMNLTQFSDRKINGVYSMGAAKHFPDPVQCLNQTKDILTDKGIAYFADFCSDGKYSGTKEVVSKLNVSAFSSTILRPLFYFGLKKEAPTASEVKSWGAEVSKNCEVDIHFSFDGLVFVVLLQKAEDGI